MKNQWRFRLMALVLATAFVVPAQSADRERILKSAVFPGMGQLGDGQVVKGLCLMGGEAVLLSVMFGQIAKSQAYALETKRDSILFIMGGDYAHVDTVYRQWRTAFEGSEKAKTVSYVFGGLAVAWWALNVVDAALFGPKARSPEEDAIRDAVFERTSLALTDGGAALRYRLDF